MENEKKWILYITIPLMVSIFIICMTIIYLNIHPYPLNIGFTMDNNTLEAIRLANINLTNSTL